MMGKVGSRRQATTALSIRDGEDKVVFDGASDVEATEKNMGCFKTKHEPQSQRAPKI
jgi:hypothetical protein